VPATEKITGYVASYDDWRGKRLAELRELINHTAPVLTEDFKWGVPVWTHNGLICAISAFKDHVKINFFKGVYLGVYADKFNSGLDSKEHRSINFAADDIVDKKLIADLIKAAVVYNSK
jgi:hypothetical protein